MKTTYRICCGPTLSSLLKTSVWLHRGCWSWIGQQWSLHIILLCSHRPGYSEPAPRMLTVFAYFHPQDPLAFCCLVPLTPCSPPSTVSLYRVSYSSPCPLSSAQMARKTTQSPTLANVVQYPGTLGDKTGLQMSYFSKIRGFLGGLGMATARSLSKMDPFPVVLWLITISNLVHVVSGRAC